MQKEPTDIHAAGDRVGVYEIIMFLRMNPHTKHNVEAPVYLVKCTKCGNLREATHVMLKRIRGGKACNQCSRRLNEQFRNSIKVGATLTGLKLLWGDDIGGWMTECKRCGSGYRVSTDQLIRRRKSRMERCGNCRTPSHSKLAEPSMRLLAEVSEPERLWNQASRKLAVLGYSRPSNR